MSPTADLRPRDYGTPLATKLGVKPDTRLALIHAPDHLENLLTPLPAGVRVRRTARGPVEVAVAFFTRIADLRREMEHLRTVIVSDGGLWLAWPKKSSGADTDVAFGAVQAAGLEIGLVDNKVAAIDETWSGLRLVVRRVDR